MDNTYHLCIGTCYIYEILFSNNLLEQNHSLLSRDAKYYYAEKGQINRIITSGSF